MRCSVLPSYTNVLVDHFLNLRKFNFAQPSLTTQKQSVRNTANGMYMEAHKHRERCRIQPTQQYLSCAGVSVP